MRFGSALLAALAATALLGGTRANAPARRLVVLGIDGLDPQLLERFIGEGAMPAFAALSERGGRSELATSVPPQSPVAWSDFITGTGPGEHGVFDFVALDRQTLQPYLSTARVEQAAAYAQVAAAGMYPVVNLLARGGGAMSGGRKSAIVGITPPEGFPPALWEALVQKGRLRPVPGTQRNRRYELVEGGGA